MSRTVAAHAHAVRCISCARFVNLRNLQKAVRNFVIAHAQFGNVWPKPDPNPNRDTAQRILLIWQADTE